MLRAGLPLIALFAVFPMVLAVPMGRIIDRIGIRKPLMLGRPSPSVSRMTMPVGPLGGVSSTW